MPRGWWLGMSIKVIIKKKMPAIILAVLLAKRSSLTAGPVALSSPRDLPCLSTFGLLIVL